MTLAMFLTYGLIGFTVGTFVGLTISPLVVWLLDRYTDWY